MTYSVGKETDEATARKVASDNAAVEQAATREANGLDAQINALENGDISPSDIPAAGNNTHAQLYGEVGIAAATGGSAVGEMLQMGAGIIREGMDKNLGGMENSVKPSGAPSKVSKDILGHNVRSIKTAPSFPLSDRREAQKCSQGDEKPKGIEADAAKCADALRGMKDGCNVVQQAAKRERGYANHRVNTASAENGAPVPNGMGGGSTANANRPPQAQVPKGMAYNNDKFANGPSYTIKDEDLV